ncbi:Short-chain dehydrogenase/reductase SDR [Planoprotostelium fungivorum]|uniref:Short-chain dehydrogenase/reductase SDR n=1 Tax=Planoprotostelium fungivorum TaxID=1890364 RepID=A0A2P6NQL9_9EUKA|nr:Short-chain dehydrogenase/reductase SDR [Planoprotostelium fungivorum]
MRESKLMLFVIYVSLLLDYIEILIHQILALVFFIQPAITPQKNKSAILVTGTSSGIGRYLVELYTSRGYIVIATVRRSEDAEELTSISGRVRTILADVTDLKQCQEALKSVQDILEREDLILHALVNNAGIQINGLSAVTTEESLRKIMEVNFFGPMRMIRLFFPLLCKTGGRIINTGSTTSFFPAGIVGAYGATKGALRNMTQSLQVECYPFGLRVCEVDPGLIRSNIRSDWWSTQFKPADDVNCTMTSADAGSELYQRVEDVTRAFQKAVGEAMEKSAPPPWLLNAAYAHAVEGRYPLPFYHPSLDCKLMKLFNFIFTDNLKSLLMQKWATSLVK